MDGQKKRVFIGALIRSWVVLTPNEHKALVLVGGLFLLGVAVRLWMSLGP